MGLTEFPVFGFPRQTNNFTFLGENWTTEYPVTNLQNAVFANVARSTSLGNGTPGDQPAVIGISDVPRRVRLIGVAAHSITRSGEYRFYGYSDTLMTQLAVDTGRQPVWPAPYTYEGRPWDTPFFWTGQYTAEELAGQIPFLPILLDADYSLSAFRIEFYDQANPAGYIQIGMLEIASCWQPSSGVEIGAQDGYRFYTQTSELLGGLKRYDVYPPSYVFQGNIPMLTEDERQNYAMELVRQCGYHVPFIFILHPTRPSTWIRTAKMMSIREPGLFTYASYGYDAFPLNLEEYKG